MGLLFHLEVISQVAGRWADEYRNELKGGKARRQIVNGCRNNEKQMVNLAGKLIKNFLSKSC